MRIKMYHEHEEELTSIQREENKKDRIVLRCHTDDKIKFKQTAKQNKKTLSLWIIENLKKAL